MHSHLARGRRAAGVLTAAIAATALAAPAAQAAYPGTNGDLALALAENVWVPTDVGLIASSGTNLRPFGLTMDRVDDPVVSPDGARIAFAGDASDDSSMEIYVVDADGTDLKRLTGNNDEWDAAPTWSPDGTQIAWERGGDIWAMNADGTNQRALTTGWPSDESPAWGPNGIAYSSNATDESYDIWHMGSDGGNPQQITTTDDVDEESPNWSADGAKLVFVREPAYVPNDLAARGRSGSDDLYVHTLADGSELRLTDDWTDDFEPAFSPDGTMVAYRKTDAVPVRSTRGESVTGIYLINADGTNERVLAGDLDATDPDWGPGVVPPKQEEQPPVTQQPQQQEQPRNDVPSRTCLSRRRFAIHLPNRFGRIKSARVVVNGKRARVRNTKPHKSAVVDLRKLPKGTFSVKVTIKLASGRTLRSVRRYRTCVPSPKS